MTAFDCPKHGNLVLDLARGRLDDSRAEKAEKARRDCAVCSQWWDETFWNAALADLDSEVASVFQEFLPPRRRRRGWLAAAAAAVLLVGGGTASLLWRDVPAPQGPSNDRVSTWDFETGTVAETDVSGATDEQNALFFGGFESGDLSEWSSGS